MKTTKRTRIEGPKLASWDAVDRNLRRIGELDIKSEAVEASLTERCNELREAAAREAGPMKDERDTLAREVKEFCEARREEMEAGKKSRVLNFGTVGFHRITKLDIKRIAETLRDLRGQGLMDAIRVKEEPNKEVLAGYGDEILATVGVTRKTEDTFFLEVDRERIVAGRGA